MREMGREDGSVWKWLTAALLTVLLALSGVLWTSAQEVTRGNTEAIAVVADALDDCTYRITTIEADYEHIIRLLIGLKRDVEDLKRGEYE